MDEARADDEIGAGELPHERGHASRLVVEVGVHDCDQVAARRVDARTNGAGQTAIGRPRHDPDARFGKEAHARALRRAVHACI
ncbi:MAG TPA: hypothetical protein VI072_35065 [Polyangiaceae bacterium]